MKFAQCHMTYYGSRAGVLKTTPQNPASKGAHQHDIHVIKDSCYTERRLSAKIPWFSLHSLKKWSWKLATVTASGFPRWLGGNKSARHCSRHRRCSSIPELEGSHWVGSGNPLEFSCLWNPMDSGAWKAIAHGVRRSQTWLSMHVGATGQYYYKILIISIFFNWIYLCKTIESFVSKILNKR